MAVLQPMSNCGGSHHNFCRKRRINDPYESSLNECVALPYCLIVNSRICLLLRRSSYQLIEDMRFLISKEALEGIAS